MKKRLIALSLVLALVVVFAVPAMGIVYGKDDDGYFAAVEIDESLWMKVASYSSYAFVKSGDWNANYTKTSWKEIKTDSLSSDKYMDFSKIIKEEGFLLFTTVAYKSAFKTHASITSVQSSGNDTYVVIPVEAPNEKPKKPAKDAFVYGVDGDNKSSVTIELGENMEWIAANTRSDSWKQVTAKKTAAIPLTANKQDIWMRVASGTSGKGPSQFIKLSIPALPAGPSAKLDLAKGTISAKAGTEWGVSELSNSGAFLDGIDKDEPTATKTSVPTGENFIDLSKLPGTLDPASGYIVWLRTKPDGKPISAWTAVLVKASKSEEPTEDNFVLSAKKTVLVTGDVVLEVYNSSDKKWKKVKKFKDSDLTSDVTVRVAGSKSILPSDPVKVKLTSSGIEVS